MGVIQRYSPISKLEYRDTFKGLGGGYKAGLELMSKRGPIQWTVKFWNMNIGCFEMVFVLSTCWVGGWSYSNFRYSTVRVQGTIMGVCVCTYINRYIYIYTYIDRVHTFGFSNSTGPGKHRLM